MKMSNPNRSYSASLIIVVMLMITVYYPVLIDTAVVRPEKLDHQLIKQFGPKNVRISRAIENNEEGKEEPKRYCYNAACGWAVYERDLRSIEYYMRNTCECPETYKCVRVGDDLSASAYVYRCRENITADDILFSEDAN